MVSIKWGVVISGIVILFALLALSWGVLRWMGVGFEIEFLSSPTGYLLILLTGILIAVSGFLPLRWGKVLREVATFCLFILLIFIEMSLMKPFVKETTVDLAECKNVFFPTVQSSQAVAEGLKYTSCIFTGYFPAGTQGEGDLGWVVFYIFYLILPFAFMWAFLNGLMSGMGMGSMFGGQNTTRILSFIIAMYAARVMFGGILLSFLGYGSWGLVAIFGAAFLSRGLKYIFDRWYSIEEMTQETRQAIETELSLEDQVRPIIIRELNHMRTIRDTSALQSSLLSLIQPTNVLFQKLSPATQNNLRVAIEGNLTAPTNAIDAALHVLSTS